MPEQTQIRVGVDTGSAVLAKARNIGAPILVSANALWNEKRGEFTERYRAFTGFDVALDSGGFVAMKLYGRYRWTVDQYAGLVAKMLPTWWAQMDFCCEPEIAADSASVAKRIDSTAEHLHRCQDAAKLLGIARPVPVLQGWKPEDYVSGPAYEMPFDWPALVGVGSVCRRPVHGKTGLLAVVYALDSKLPPHVRLHLFGVKSSALKLLLKEFPERIASVDSMAWNMAARWHACKSGVPQDGALRADFMERWYSRQATIADETEPGTQPRLL